jgi:hypothetical protein
MATKGTKSAQKQGKKPGKKPARTKLSAPIQKSSRNGRKKVTRRRKMSTAVSVREYPPPFQYRWITGPYVPPTAGVGSKLHDEMLGDVEVEGTTEAPIPWPAIRYRNQIIPILCGALVRAVCEEEERAVAHYWGVTKYIVNKWREAIAGQQGSGLVHTALAIKRQDPAFRKQWGYRDG